MCVLPRLPPSISIGFSRINVTHGLNLINKSVWLLKTASAPPFLFFFLHLPFFIQQMELTQNREKKPVRKCSGSKHCSSVYPRPIPRPDGSRLTRAGSTGPLVPGRASYLQKGHSAGGYPPLASGGNIWWCLVSGKTNKLGWSSFPCPFLKLYSPYSTLDSWEKTTIYLCFQSIHLCSNCTCRK